MSGKFSIGDKVVKHPAGKAGPVYEVVATWSPGSMIDVRKLVNDKLYEREDEENFRLVKEG